MWSARQKTSETMWSGADQITWSIYVVEAENNISFLSPQVLYCNLEKRICQGPLKIKNSTQNLIRSKQRKSIVATISIIKALTRLHTHDGDGRILLSGGSKRLSALKI